VKIGSKICSKCKEEKELNFFELRKDRKGNLIYRGQCKICVSQRRRVYYLNNKEDILDYQKNYRETHDLKDKKREYYRRKINGKYRTKQTTEQKRCKKKFYYLINRDAINLKNKLYIRSHKKEKSEYDKRYRGLNKEKINKIKREYDKNKRITDPYYKLRYLISRSVRGAIKKYGGKKQGLSTFKYLPYTVEELKEHLEKQFESWMNWDNWGLYDSNTWDDDDSSTWTWNIDHIIPQSKLLYTSMEEENFQKCWALENLRPYSSKQNVLDQDKREINLCQDQL
jgi:hypothetical protein